MDARTEENNMGKKQTNKLMNWVVVAVVVLAIAVVSLSFNIGQGTDTQDIQQIIQTGTKADFCANNPALDLNVRVRDMLSSQRTYLTNATLLVQNLDTGSIVSHTVGDGSSSFTTLSNLFDCNSEKGYKLFVEADGTYNSNGVIDVTPAMLSRTPVEVTIDASVYTPFKVRAYDNAEKVRLTEATTNSTDYVEGTDIQFNSGNAGVTFSNNTEALDITFTLAPVTTNRAKGVGLLVAIDTEDQNNIDDYDESLTQVWYNGVVLSEARGISENELRALSGFEHIYRVADTVGMDSNGNKVSQSTLRVYFEPEADATAKTFSPIVRFVALGDYESVKGDEVLREVGFRDDSSRTPLYAVQDITLVVN